MAEGKGLSECSPHPSVIASASEAIRRWCGVILSVAKNLLPQQNSVPYPQNPPAATPYRTPHRRGNPRGCPGRAPPRPPLSCTRHSHATLVVACPLHRDRYPLAHPEPRVYPEYGRREWSERVLPPPFRHCPSLVIVSASEAIRRRGASLYPQTSALLSSFRTQHTVIHKRSTPSFISAAHRHS